MADNIITIPGANGETGEAPKKEAVTDGTRLDMLDEWNDASRKARGLADAFQMLAASNCLQDMGRTNATAFADTLLENVERAANLGRMLMDPES